jgi:hypothetical protein
LALAFFFKATPGAYYSISRAIRAISKAVIPPIARAEAEAATTLKLYYILNIRKYINGNNNNC